MEKHNFDKNSELQQESMNEIIDDKKYLSDEIFWNYFKYQNPSFFVKEMIRANQAKIEQ